jgi:amidohydrolase
LNAGTIGYRPGPAMASSDRFSITVQGKQTHGAQPWLGVDPIVASAQIVLGLQTVVARTIDITRDPAVVTVGMIRGGVRENIIPDQVEMRGTIRSFDDGMRGDIHERVKNLAEFVARGSRAQCQVCVDKGYDVTYNDPKLTEAIVPSLQRAAGEANVQLVDKVMGAEDFSFFQNVVPGVFYFVGVTPKDADPAHAYSNHSPKFYVEESALKLGVQSLAQVACDWLESQAG